MAEVESGENKLIAGAKKMMGMSDTEESVDAIQLLEDQHEEVRELFRQFDEAGHAPQRKRRRSSRRYLKS